MTSPGISPVKVYRASDAPPGALAGESVAVLGYGHLGRTAALNLRDSGAKARIGNREDERAGGGRGGGGRLGPRGQPRGRGGGAAARGRFRGGAGGARAGRRRRVRAAPRRGDSRG